MAASHAPQPHDWTRGPAKWAAVGLLGGASAVAAVWTYVSSAGSPPAPAPAHTAVAPVTPDSTPADKAPASAEQLATHALVAAARKINLNTATIEELDLLPGVGRSTAQKIIDYRTTHGKFRTISELDNVSGIGPAKLERLRPLVTVD